MSVCGRTAPDAKNFSNDPWTSAAAGISAGKARTWLEETAFGTFQGVKDGEGYADKQGSEVLG
jgi:hypothetical protein